MGLASIPTKGLKVYSISNNKSRKFPILINAVLGNKNYPWERNLVSLDMRSLKEENQAASCYSLRTFDRFLNYFGLIKIE